MARRPSEYDYQMTARAYFHDEGTLEFDDLPAVSISTEHGAYVACWRWVADDDVRAYRSEVRSARK